MRTMVLVVMVAIVAGGLGCGRSAPPVATMPATVPTTAPVAALMIPTTATGPAETQPVVSADLPPEDPADLAVRGHLEDEVVKLDADKRAFEAVVHELSGVTQVTFFFRWNVLQPAGVDYTTPVTVHLEHVPLRKAIRVMLEEAGQGKAALGYTIDGGRVVISTREDIEARKPRITHVFDIRGMLPKPPAVLPPAVTKGDAAATTEPAVDAATAEARRKTAREVMETIMATVAPVSWVDLGGTVGTMKEEDGRLTIYQTVENQRAISQVLEQLSEVLPGMRIGVRARVLLLDKETGDRVAVRLLGESATWDYLATGRILGNGDGAKLTEALRGEKFTTLAETNTVVFEGDPFYIPLTAARVFGSGYRQANAADPGGGYVKEVSTAHPGVVIRSEETVSADRRYVVSRIKFITRELVRMETAPAPGTAPGGKRTIEVPVLSEDASPGAMLSVPDGGTVIIAGPDVGEGFPQADAAGKVGEVKRTKHLLYIIRLKIDLRM